MWRIATAALLFFAATPSQAKCHTDQFRFQVNFDTSTKMRVTSGAQCTIDLNITGRIETIAVTTPGRHGVASYNGEIGYPKIVYRSPAGYKGADSFTFSLTNKGAVANVQVSVDVE
jgi:hypothetical protein